MEQRIELPPKQPDNDSWKWPRRAAAGVILAAPVALTIAQLERLHSKLNFPKPPDLEIPPSAVPLRNNKKYARSEDQLALSIERQNNNVYLVVWRKETEKQGGALHKGVIELATDYHPSSPGQKNALFFRDHRNIDPHRTIRVAYTDLSPENDGALLHRFRSAIEELHNANTSYEEILVAVPNLYVPHQTGKTDFLRTLHKESRSIILVDEGEYGEYIWASYSQPSIKGLVNLELRVVHKNNASAIVNYMEIPLHPGGSLHFAHTPIQAFQAHNDLLKDPSLIPLKVASLLRCMHTRNGRSAVSYETMLKELGLYKGIAPSLAR